MTIREQTSSRFDLRALPIVVKIAIGMGVILLMSAVILYWVLERSNVSQTRD